MAERKVTVSKIVRMLVKDGYKTTQSQDKGNLDALPIQHYFSIALSLARKLGAHRNTIDSLLRQYITMSRRTSWIERTFTLPPPSTILEFVRLGASRAVVESLAKEFARTGSMWGYKRAVNLLGRGPDEAEVTMLTKKYIEGPSEGLDTETDLVQLANGISREFREKISREIAQRRRRLSLQCD